MHHITHTRVTSLLFHPHKGKMIGGKQTWKSHLQWYRFSNFLHYYMLCLPVDTLCWFSGVKSNCYRAERKNGYRAISFAMKAITACHVQRGNTTDFISDLSSLILSLISSTLHLTISRNTSDKRDFSHFFCRVGVMLIIYAGHMKECRLKAVSVINGIQTDRKVDFGTASKHQMNICRVWTMFLPTYRETAVTNH